MCLRFIILLFAPLSLIPPAHALAAVQQRALSQRDMFLIQTVVFQASSTQAALTRRYDAALVARSKEIAGLISKLRSQQIAQRMAARANASLRDENDRLESEIIKMAKSFNDQLAAKDTEFARERERLERAALYMLNTPQGRALIESGENATANDAAQLLAELGRIGGEIGTSEAIKQGMEVLSSRLGRPGYTLDFMIDQWATVPERYRDHWDWVELARLYRDAGNRASALKAAEKALETAPNRRGEAVAHSELAIILASSDRAASLVHIDQSHSIFKNLLLDDPNNVQLQTSVGLSFIEMGDALEITSPDRAKASYEEALKLQQRVADKDPNNPRYRLSLAVTLQRLGDLTFKNADASYSRIYNESHEIISDILKSDPDNVVFLAFLATSYEKLGNSTLNSDPIIAHALYVKSLDIRKNLINRDPSNKYYMRSKSVSHFKIGKSLLSLNPLEAVNHFYDSLEISRKLGQEDPTDFTYQKDILVVLATLASLGITDFNWHRAKTQLDLMRQNRQLMPEDIGLAAQIDALSVAEK